MIALLLQLFWTFFLIGMFTFGGGYAMLSLIQAEVVVEHAWLSESVFADIVAISQMTPGPIGINCATYVGYDVLTSAGAGHLMGVVGSMTATLAITLPSFIIVLLLVRFYTKVKGSPVFEGELVLALGLLFQHAFFDWFFICGNFWKKLLISKVLHTISYCTVMGIALWGLKLDSIPAIALAMVLAALPAFGFGVGQAFHLKVLRIGLHTRRFFKLMFKAACPYALSSLASFAYLPVGLYAVSHFAPPEFLGAYNFSHKLVILASGLMVHFISSSLITLHQTDSKILHLRDQVVFTLFIAAATTPLWLFPQIRRLSPWRLPTRDWSVRYPTRRMRSWRRSRVCEPR